MSRAQGLSAVIVLVGWIGACGETVVRVPGPGGGGPTVGPDSGPGYTPPPGRDGAAAPAADSQLATGSATCSGIIACFYTSNCQDDACDMACVAKGTAAAQQQFRALEQCEGSVFGITCKTCNDQTFDIACGTCLDNACKQQYAACGKTLTCKQAYACGDSCGETDDACWDACLAKLSGLGLAQYDASEDCWDAAVKGSCAASCSNQESDTCYTCVDAKCASQFQTCGLI